MKDVVGCVTKSQCRRLKSGNQWKAGGATAATPLRGCALIEACSSVHCYVIGSVSTTKLLLGKTTTE